MPPGSWQSADIGAVKLTGAWSNSGDVWTVSGSGANIASTADQFRYVYQPLNGDGTIVAKVVSHTYARTGAKAGLMIRESLAPDSKHAMVLVSPNLGVALRYRTNTAGTTAGVNGGAGVPPVWLKLARSGNTFTAWRSADGLTWTQFATRTVAMGSSVYVGMAVTSAGGNTLSTAVFCTADPAAATCP